MRVQKSQEKMGRSIKDVAEEGSHHAPCSLTFHSSSKSISLHSSPLSEKTDRPTIGPSFSPVIPVKPSIFEGYSKEHASTGVGRSQSRPTHEENEQLEENEDFLCQGSNKAFPSSKKARYASPHKEANSKLRRGSETKNSLLLASEKAKYESGFATLTPTERLCINENKETSIAISMNLPSTNLKGQDLSPAHPIDPLEQPKGSTPPMNPVARAAQSATLERGIINTMLTKNLDSPIEMSFQQFRQAQRLDSQSLLKTADVLPIKSILIKSNRARSSASKKKVTFSANIILILYYSDDQD